MSDRAITAPTQFVEVQGRRLAYRPKNPAFPSEDVLRTLRSTTVPILHVGGDHDIICPVENWYAFNAQLPSLTLITYPRAGHAPHHQYPEEAAAQIAGFINGTRQAGAAA